VRAATVVGCCVSRSAERRAVEGGDSAARFADRDWGVEAGGLVVGDGAGAFRVGAGSAEGCLAAGATLDGASGPPRGGVASVGGPAGGAVDASGAPAGGGLAARGTPPPGVA
jgi:hypothetical protein